MMNYRASLRISGQFSIRSIVGQSLPGAAGSLHVTEISRERYDERGIPRPVKRGIRRTRLFFYFLR